MKLIFIPKSNAFIVVRALSMFVAVATKRLFPKRLMAVAFADGVHICEQRWL